MVRLTNRKAIAMIELIFAIVVMGFAMLAIPNITAQSAKSTQSAINQEAVAATAAQMQNILSMQWDDANTGASGMPILSTGAGGAVVRAGASGGSGLPEGRRVVDNSNNTLNASPSSLAKVDNDDMGDYNGINTTLQLFDIKTTQDYADQRLNLRSNVIYIANPGVLPYNFNPNAAAAAGTTDIKMISVTLSSTEQSQANKNIRLNGFSCNIGVPTLRWSQL